MTKLKSRKSVTKRFRITKTGKILRRPSGLDHYRAKKSGKKVRESRKWIKVSESETKEIRKILKI